MAFLIDAMDTRIADIQGFHSLLGQAPFGILPVFATKKRPMHLSGYSIALPPGESIAALKDPHSAYVEALRALRTTLLSTAGRASAAGRPGYQLDRRGGKEHAQRKSCRGARPAGQTRSAGRLRPAPAQSACAFRCFHRGWPELGAGRQAGPRSDLPALVRVDQARVWM